MKSYSKSRSGNAPKLKLNPESSGKTIERSFSSKVPSMVNALTLNLLSSLRSFWVRLLVSPKMLASPKLPSLDTMFIQSGPDTFWKNKNSGWIACKSIENEPTSLITISSNSICGIPAREVSKAVWISLVSVSENSTPSRKSPWVVSKLMRGVPKSPVLIEWNISFPSPPISLNHSVLAFDSLQLRITKSSSPLELIFPIPVSNSSV